MVNYLNESYPDYNELVLTRKNGIEDIKINLLKKPIQTSQQLYIYKNSYSGFDITYTEQYSSLDTQKGGRFSIGIFEHNKENYMFINDKLSSKVWLNFKTKNMLTSLKNMIIKEFNSFYNPQKLYAYKFLPKKKKIITSEQLVTTAIADDSESSRVECDPGLTLNNENILIQLNEIDTYIYEIEPHHDSFKLPNQSEGVAWKSFFWKYKKIQLIDKLSSLEEKEEKFLKLLTKFVNNNKDILKRLFAREEFNKIDTLFQNYWEKYKIEDKNVEKFLSSVDTIDLIALGLK